MSLKLQVVLVFCFAFAAGCLLLVAAQSVQHEQNQNRRLKYEIEQEYTTYRMLQTEWSFLSRPERVDELMQVLENGEDIKPGMILELEDVRRSEPVMLQQQYQEDAP